MVDFRLTPVKPRQKGWGEGLIDEIEDLSIKQTLGLPLSAPLTFGAGALSGLSFGGLDFTDEVQHHLGSLALPDKLKTGLEIAGELGGSFVPYVGSSALASKLYKGFDLASKMARGAITFGAPEAVRQLVEKEMDPLGGARSLSTGALFALPKKFAAPAILGSELALGAEPQEAAVAAAFGALFAGGGKARNTEIPTKDPASFKKIPVAGALPPHGPSHPPHSNTKVSPFMVGPETGVAPGGGISFGARVAQAPTPGRPPTPPAQPVKNALSELAENPGVVSAERKQSFAAGQLELPFFSTPKSQLDVLKSIQNASGLSKEQKVQTEIFTNKVEEVARTMSPAQTGVSLVKAIKEKGPNSVEANLYRYAQATQTGMVVPKDAPMANKLLLDVPKQMGVELIEQGPNNIYHQKALVEEYLAKIRANGPDGEVKAAQLSQLFDDVAAAVEQAQASGKPGLSEEQKKLFRQVITHLERSVKANFRDPAKEAAKIARKQLEQNTRKPEDVDAFVKTLPEAYRELPAPVMSGILRDAAKRRKVLERNPVVTFDEVYDDLYAQASPTFVELHRRVSDTGAEILTKSVKTTKATKSGVQRRYDTNNFSFTFAGQEVKNFDSAKKAKEWLTQLETGGIDPENIHELRMLAFPRGIIVDYTNKDMHLVNQFTGEQLFVGKQGVLKDIQSKYRTAELVSTKTLDKFRDVSRPVNKDLMESIEKYGIQEPLILAYFKPNKSAILFEGHHRLEAAKKLGLKEVPVRVIRYDTAWSPQSFTNRKPIPVSGVAPNKDGYVAGDLAPSSIGLPSRKLQPKGSSTALGLQSIDDAVRIVRNAPQVHTVARVIGPRVTTTRPLPGAGGHGGVATEQSLPLCPISLLEP